MVVVGAGIAGVATAFSILRTTSVRVLLIERDRVGRGASGHNAGQLTTYFERPLVEIADQFGAQPAVEGQRGIESAHDLLDTMVAEAGATVRVERFTGRMGMFNLHHVQTHLSGNLIRSQAGLLALPCHISEEAEFLAEIPDQLDGLYTVVPQARIRELLEIDDDRYRAVLSNQAGCANSGLLCQQVLGHLERDYAARFQFVDRTAVGRIVVGEHEATVHAGDRTVAAAQVVLCTNGFVDYGVIDKDGSPVGPADDQRITGRVAHMTAFVDRPRPAAAMSYIRNTVIGSNASPYVYVTRRSYDRPQDTVTLTCMGGPEYPFHEPAYDRRLPFPGALLAAMDEQVRPFAQPGRAAGRPYDFHWHGLMGYNDSGVRVVGPHPRWRRLFYNLGCNGVGFLPSIFGGHRVAQLLAGRALGPSIFDPR